ncbi:DUF6883 domain-containing protein [Oscillatoria sp. HE19RPO]|uniref:DUF6883 domain-containing protein n=1 Tax=Oscillatoria sp. HE19RPO TaxID=2954806 RepID=UPI0020C454DE|nr:DUF6883 domain-containing protein [Oscillatoria sp. HE19RPO]
MKIPDNAIIPDAKLTRYLLVFHVRNDKSQFLARAGFTLENSERLDAALRQLIASNEAIYDRTDKYGTYYQVKGVLLGVYPVNLDIVSVWLCRKTDGQFQFITLVPNKELTS